MSRLAWTLAAGLALFTADAWAYPAFVGYGYTTCLTCHYNPYGNGPLSDYGRALGATTISAKPPWAMGASDEKLAEASGFLGTAPLPSWLRPSVGVRGMLYLANLKEGVAPRFIPMQLEGNITLKALKDRLNVSLTVGYAPPPAALPAEEKSKAAVLIAREHYVGFRPAKAVGFYLGMMDIAFGIRIPEHIAYSRQATGLAMNDQTHGFLTHLLLADWEIGMHAFAGNLYQAAGLRQRGASLIIEKDVAKAVRLGASALASTSAFRARQLASIHAKAGFSSGVGLLFESGVIREAPFIENPALGHFVFLQSTARVARGLHWLVTLESYRRDLREADGAWEFRAGPGIQYFPFQRFELRTDFLASRRFGQGTSPDIFQLLMQGHLWL